MAGLTPMAAPSFQPVAQQHFGQAAAASTEAPNRFAPRVIGDEERASWEATRAKLVAYSGDKRLEQVQKGIVGITTFPRISKAPQLSEWLRNIVGEMSKVAIDPELMSRWIREVTVAAEVPTAADFQKWFDLLGSSGKGFVRADMFILEALKTYALKDAPVLRSTIVAKEQEFLRAACNFKG